jgi:hypothetical protein
VSAETSGVASLGDETVSAEASGVASLGDAREVASDGML